MRSDNGMNSSDATSTIIMMEEMTTSLWICGLHRQQWGLNRMINDKYLVFTNDEIQTLLTDIGEIMEQSTKTILWIVAFITLPLTIPLAIISFGILLTALLLVLSIFITLIREILIAAVIIVILYVIYKWLSING